MSQLTDDQMDQAAQCFANAATAAKIAEDWVTAICSIGSGFAGVAPADIALLRSKAQDFVVAARKAADAVGPLKNRRNPNEGAR